MAANSDPIFSLTPHIAGVEFTSTDTTTVKSLFTGAANGSRIDGIACSTNDTTAVNLAFYIQIGGAGTNYYIGNVQVPIGAGYTTVARIDAITTLAPAFFKALVLNNGDVLKCNCVAPMTATKTTDVLALGGDF